MNKEGDGLCSADRQTFANLAPRANSIRNRYREEFGKDAVGKKKRMIPFIY